jgi:hypothetical protein
MFDFFYIGLQDMLSSLGGIGAVLKGILGNFGTLLIILFVADLIWMLKKKHKFELLKF